MSDLSPYQAPESELSENTFQANSEILVNKVPVMRGAYWFFDGFNRFFRNPFRWTALGAFNFLLFLGMVIIAIIPILGSFVPTLLYPVIIAGFMRAAQNQTRQEMRATDIFYGFQHQTGQLFINGALYLAMTIGAMIITFIIMLVLGFSAFSMIEGSSNSTMMLLGLLMVLIFMALWLPIMMAIWFSPALIALNNQEGTTAIALSFKGCLRNFWPYMIYSITALVFTVGLIAIIMLFVWAVSSGSMSFDAIPDGLKVGGGIFLGLFSFFCGGPIFFAGVYSAYTDIYSTAEQGD
ncbi:BPSS1780 family membrane protein [Pleionea litopenaei]|uniref:BPSS1780 family membrane protein n=1 Tax=Pleionea litopenaei TaxID=3070815 RepID=A0AA51RSZ1_9GAMM|nr:BPSS1780 family membrane protein [Pleionea sp. HL-JVS1]WMS86924.1 BPSS1780 family membrane protein [Pleionea sp. HL-JVS1]